MLKPMQDKIIVGHVHELGVSDMSVRDFYKENWNRKIALTDERFYKWQFIDSHERYKDCCIIAYNTEKKQILGVMGLNKRDFFLQQKSLKGAELTTWVISSDMKGTGLGNKIIDFIQENYQVAIGMGITDAALPVYMKYNFKFIKTIPRFVKVINFESIKHFSKYNLLGEKLIKLREIKLTNNFYASELSEADLNLIFEKFKYYADCFSRSKENFRWRFKNHPYLQYKSFLVKSKSSTSGIAIVLREEISLKEFRILHVIDCFGDVNDISSAINFIERYASENKFDIIDFYSTHPLINSYFINAGWFSINDESCFQFPHLFQPIEMRDPPTTSLIYWCKPDLMIDLSRFYVTKQDADFDRPTLHTE
jgi:hypothetical protein